MEEETISISETLEYTRFNNETEEADESDKYFINKVLSASRYITNTASLLSSLRRPKDEIDIFCIKLYKYYNGHGFFKIIFSQIFSLITLSFVIFFSIFLYQSVKWDKIINYKGNEMIKLTEFINWNDYFKLNWYLIISIIIYLIFIIWKLIKLVYDIKNAIEMRYFYRDRLGITDNEIDLCTWNEIIIRLEETNKMIPIFENNNLSERHKMDAYIIANRIMRTENYLIAMYNKGIINLEIPCLNINFLTKILEWNINYCVLNAIFDNKMNIKEEYRSYSMINRNKLIRKMKQRINIMTILNIILIPFTIIFVLIYILFKYGEEFYKNPKNLSTREWSMYSRWKIREFNELIHILNQRLEKGGVYTQEFIDKLPTNKYIVLLLKLVVFILSSIVITLILITMVNDNIILNVEITQGKSLLWLLGISGSILAICRNYTKDKNTLKFKYKKGYQEGEKEYKLDKVAEYIHYIPESWVKDPIRYKSKIIEMYPYQIISLLKEIIGILLTPIIMKVSVYNSVEIIVDFIYTYTKYDKELGYVCQFALFSENISEIVEMDQIDQIKMEKSYINFKKNNPEYNQIDKLEEFPKGILTKTI